MVVEILGFKQMSAIFYETEIEVLQMVETEEFKVLYKKMYT